MVKDNMLVKYDVNLLLFLIIYLFLINGNVYWKLTKFSGLLDTKKVFALTGCPIFGLFLLGYLFAFANLIGAIFGTIFSLMFLLHLFIGNLLIIEKIPSVTKPFANFYCDLTNRIDFFFSQEIKSFDFLNL